MIVLDASAAVEALLGSETGQLVLDRLEWHAETHAPEHFHIEAISALRRYALRGELGELRAARAMTMLGELRVVHYPVFDLRDTIWELRERLSAYDAAYLALARRLDLSLLTTDTGLAAAARAEGRLTEIESACALNAAEVRRLQQSLTAGGVAVFPTDTVYGLGCDPDDAVAVRRLYELKGRPPERPAAIMFFALPAALQALPELSERERAAIAALLPGPLTILLPNPQRRYPLACGPNPLTLGLRVPRLPQRLAALEGLERPLLQSSANFSGEPDARALSQVPAELRSGADLVLDGGTLPGTASTVIDLGDYERTGQWRIVRAGPVEEGEIERILGSC